MNKSVISVWTIVCFVAGCRTDRPATPIRSAVEFTHELPAGTVGVRKLSPAEYPSFAAAGRENVPAVVAAIDHSLDYFSAPSKAGYRFLDIDRDRAVATLHALRELVAAGGDVDAQIRLRFDVYQSFGGYDPATGRYTGDVLFTAYFTPTYDASATRGGRFQYPLYKRPAALVTVDPDHAAMRSPTGDTGPCPTRRQIEQGHALDGDELVWLADLFDAYVVTVQGSARLRLPDGRIMEVGYAGNNGYPYSGPALKMVADGVIAKDQISLQSMRAYFAAHPGSAEQYLLNNDRTVFFAPTAGGPFGCLGVPVTTMATIATDKLVFPAGLPALVVTSVPDAAGGIRLFSGFMLDQDRGGAIRSAGRCDIYMGLGEQAGRELNVGKLYYIVLKPGM